MNLLLWAVQLILAGTFAVSGYRKIFMYDSPEGLLPSPRMLSRRSAKLVGTTELLASAGLVLPYLTGIVPTLTPLAALGAAVLMVSAAAFHVLRREYKRTAIPFALLLLALFVAYGRA